MADTTSESSQQTSKNFSKVFSRKVNRTRERFLHSLGKADRTQDGEFEENVQLFNNQQNAAQKLQKEIKNYITCLKAMQNASINIYNAIRETYEPNWSGYTDIVNAIEQLSFLWEDYVKRLQTEVQDPLSIYMSRFPDVRARIAKRGRKLVDYDSLRHKLQALENAKKRDETKINKATEELQEAEMIYHSINDEMRYELPQLYESRINFLASNFAAFFNVEGKFQEESFKIKHDMTETAEKLQRTHHKGAGILQSHSPVKLPINLRNGGLDDSASAVDLSRDQLSVENSPSSKRNSYQAETPPVSGKSTPVPKSRESMHHYTNETPEPPPHKESEATNGEPESPDVSTNRNDDQTYEPVNVRRDGRLSGTHTTESRDDDDGLVGTDHAHSPHAAYRKEEEYADETEYANDSILKDDNENSKDEESDGIYRVPSSNEPLHDHVPFGANVLYKQPHNQDSTVHSSHAPSTPQAAQIASDSSPASCTAPRQFASPPQVLGVAAQEFTTAASSKLPNSPHNTPDKATNVQDNSQHGLPQGQESGRKLAQEAIKPDPDMSRESRGENIDSMLPNDVFDNLKNSPRPRPSPDIPPRVPSRSVTPSTRDAEQEIEAILRNAHDDVITQPPAGWDQPEVAKLHDQKMPKEKATPRQIKPKRKSAPPPVLMQGHLRESHSLGTERNNDLIDHPVSAPPTNLRFDETFHDMSGNFHSDPFHGEDPFRHDPFTSNDMLATPAKGFEDVAFVPDSTFSDPFQAAAKEVLSENDPFAPTQGPTSAQTMATKNSTNFASSFDDDFNTAFETRLFGQLESDAAKGNAVKIKAPEAFEDSFSGENPEIPDEVRTEAGRHSPKSDENLLTRMVSDSGEPYDNQFPEVALPSKSTQNETPVVSSNNASAVVVDMNFSGQPPLNYGLSKDMLQITEPDGKRQQTEKKVPSDALPMQDLFADLDPFRMVKEQERNHTEAGKKRHFSLEKGHQENSANKFENAELNAVPEASYAWVHDKGSPMVTAGMEEGNGVVHEGSVTLPENQNGGEAGNQDGGQADDEHVAKVTHLDESNILYRVQATHMYTGEDTDELTFDPGDVICVVPWDDPEEQDEGWLNGIKEGTGERGVFPANFTKRL